jgi:hypothetical protein
MELEKPKPFQRNMTDEEQVEAFELALDALVNMYAEEFDLSYVSMVGVLAVKQSELCNAALDDGENYDEEEDWQV